MPTLKLPPRRREGSLAAPSTRRASVGRKRAEPDTSTYEGRFARRLNELLEVRDITPADLAVKMGVTTQAVWDWLAGRSTPRMNLWPKLAKALGASSPDDLLPPFPKK